jgi:hypothetical protein
MFDSVRTHRPRRADLDPRIAAPVPEPEGPMIPSPSHVARADELLSAADRDLALAGLAARSTDRYAAAHLAALRTAAAVLAARPPGAAGPPLRHRDGRRRRPPANAWAELAVTAPELASWAAHFTASAQKRAAASAGLSSAVTDTEADGLMRDSGTFLGVVRALLAA